MKFLKNISNPNKKTAIIVGSIAAVSVISILLFKRKSEKTKSKAISFLGKVEEEFNPSTTVDGNLAFEDNIIKNEKNSKVIWLSNDEVSKLAKLIWDAWSIFGDNEKQVYSQLEATKSKAQIAQLSDKYKEYSNGTALKFDLKARLSQDEFNEAMKIINSKPDKTFYN